jgi:hypothetical protein
LKPNFPSLANREFFCGSREFQPLERGADSRFTAVTGKEPGTNNVLEEHGGSLRRDSGLAQADGIGGLDSIIKSRHWANYTLKQAGLPKAF